MQSADEARIDTSAPLPSTLPELEELRQRVVSASQGIEVQLGDLNHTVSGKRVSAEEWNAWRQRAKTALRHYRAYLARIKTAISAQRERNTRKFDACNALAKSWRAAGRINVAEELERALSGSWVDEGHRAVVSSDHA